MFEWFNDSKTVVIWTPGDNKARSDCLATRSLKNY